MAHNKVRITSDEDGRTRIFINGEEAHFVTRFSLEQEGGEKFPTLSIDLAADDLEIGAAAMFVDK